MRAVVRLVVLVVASLAPSALHGQTVTAIKTGEEVTGLSKQCYYALGSTKYTKTVSSVELCPVSIETSLIPKPAESKTGSASGGADGCSSGVSGWWGVAACALAGHAQDVADRRAQGEANVPAGKPAPAVSASHPGSVVVATKPTPAADWKPVFAPMGPTRGSWAFVHSWREWRNLGLRTDRSFITLSVADSQFNGVRAIVLLTDIYVGHDPNKVESRTRSFLRTSDLRPIREEVETYVDANEAADAHLCYQVDYADSVARVTTIIADRMTPPLLSVRLSGSPILPLTGWWAMAFSGRLTGSSPAEYAIVSPFGGEGRIGIFRGAPSIQSAEGIRALAVGFYTTAGGKPGGWGFFLDEATRDPTFVAIGKDLYARAPAGAKIPSILGRSDLRGGRCVFR